MNRKTRFIAPFGVTHLGRHYWKAMIDGEWVDDESYRDLIAKFEAAKKAYAKQQRAAKAQTL